MTNLKNITLALLTLSFAGFSYAQALPQTPLQVAQAFEKDFNANNLNGLMRLYGPHSIFVPSPGVSLNTPEQIRGALTQFMAPKVPIKMVVRQIYQNKETALIISDWSIKGTDPQGNPVDLSGTGADIAAKRPDGSWGYAIDNPFGVAPKSP
ncbi:MULTISPECIES: YybH family protein [Pseudomonas]|uniref:YybH family protein n=1 Tax=Pseudomonas TaxID=286 RepID=UPI000C07B40B|nr:MULTISPECIES: DUF4440 domain-containing protein [Pseudomonas]MBH3424905.1 DUF4440 domain-containing protein [Pseudomonas gessardii]NNA70524.1 DUF4440 domain-containing protein [Pseudomonas gessardii]PHN61109.1 hypothetical protein AO268_10755 [Pseudomonas sp. ICMP 8385]